MKISPRGITRRAFIRKSTDVSFAVAAGVTMSGAGATADQPHSTVVLVRDPDVIDARRGVNQPVLARMLDEGIAALTGKQSPRDAWKQLIDPKDIVGIKSNAWGPLPTPAELESELVSRLGQAGVDSSRISVDDRGVRRNPVFQGSTALINMRPMRTHHWSGVGGCLKNYIMFTESPPRHHADCCASLGSIWLRPELKAKTRLNILVMLTPLFGGSGPHHFELKFTWPYSGVLLSTDPVAIDSVGLKILENRRSEYFGGPKPLNPPAKHIELAETRYGVGIADLSRINIVKRGWQEQSLL